MVFTSAIRSRSLRLAVAAIYASTSSFCSEVVILATNSCSGAKVIKLTPKMVSGRVVKTEISISFELTSPRPPPKEGEFSTVSIFEITSSILLSTSSLVNLITV